MSKKHAQLSPLPNILYQLAGRLRRAVAAAEDTTEINAETYGPLKVAC